MGVRHYVVVVHGMGEQKLNQTTTPVVHRFAEARRWEKEGHFKHLLPSYLSAQSVRQGGKGHGWSEFQGIPLCPKNPQKNEDKELEPFNGTPAADSVGQNFRFVDLHWQHILERHQERYAAPAEQWAPALLARLEAPITPEGWLRPWALPLLRAVVNVALPVKTMLGFKRLELSKKIFDGFLGDAHLYGDYSRTRGKAVRHFHVILDEIMLRDFIDWCHRDKERTSEGKESMPYEPPRFTIIAHSLGSIMSFDALVYAYAKQEVREAQRAAWHSCPSIPFLGYTYQTEAEIRSWNYIRGQLRELQAGKEWNEHKAHFPQSLDDLLKCATAPVIPLLTWRDQVENFITLGSPIDKYHVLWWQKYLHMGLQKAGVPKNWNDGVDKWIDDGPQEKIPHYNFCDEQDPVGHRLNVARGTMNYKKIFDPGRNSERDIVFRRYAVPGLAHTRYWGDGELFKGIVEKIIDQEDLSYFECEKFRNRKKAFKQALVWAYFRVPFFAALATGLLIIYATCGDTLIYQIVAGLGAVLLWTRPNLRKAYRDESDPETFAHPTRKARLKSLWLIGKIRFRRGIFAHLVAGMVEWRRVLLKMEEESPNCFSCGKSEFHFWGRFLWRFAVALGIACLFCTYGYTSSETIDTFDWRHAVTMSGIILSVSYMGTMLYVACQFLMAKYCQKRI